jgi:hypothetical protein
MRDETLVEPFAVQEYLIDNFTDHHVEDGLLTFAAYRQMPVSRVYISRPKVIVCRFIMRVTEVSEAQERTRRALRAIPFAQQAATRRPPGKLLS